MYIIIDCTYALNTSMLYTKHKYEYVKKNMPIQHLAVVFPSEKL